MKKGKNSRKRKKINKNNLKRKQEILKYKKLRASRVKKKMKFLLLSNSHLGLRKHLMPGLNGKTSSKNFMKLISLLSSKSGNRKLPSMKVW